MAKNAIESAEDQLIARYFRPLAAAVGALGLGDDAAVLAPPPGCDLVLTTDGVIEDVHFFADDPPDEVARKALRMNLSDLAAKGATPLGFLLSIALPRSRDEGWVAAFAAGLGEDASAYGCPLFGGDTDHTPGPTSVSIAAFGAVPHGRMVKRSTARAGDRIVVTGSIGDAALGVKLRRDPLLAKAWQLTPAMSAHLLQRYLLPQPRVALVKAVLQHATAAIDISDGLAGDLAKLCRASSVAAEVDIGAVPLSQAARAAVAAAPELIETIMTGGDDYEILLALSPDALSAFYAAARSAGVTVSEIGQLRAGEGTRLTHAGKALEFARPSYSHF